MDYESPERTAPVQTISGGQMKRLLIILVMIMFTLSGVMIAEAHDRDRKKKRNRAHKYELYETHIHHFYPHHPQRPHKRHKDSWRYYHRNRPPHPYPYYRGHWKRHDWERYRKHHHGRYNHGKYYRDNRNHLKFKFCDGNGVCFSFSIKE